MLVILAAVALGLGGGACGAGSSKRATSTTSAAAHRSSSSTAAVAPNFSTHNNDRDNDGDNNDDDNGVLYFGHLASAADRRSSVALVTRYSAAAAAEDGASGCGMLVPFVAESVAEQDGHSPALLGSTCAVVLSKLFKLHHRLLVEKHATLRVSAVRVEADKALVVLDFPTIPEVRQITQRRVGGAWKVLHLLDGILE